MASKWYFTVQTQACLAPESVFHHHNILEYVEIHPLESRQNFLFLRITWRMRKEVKIFAIYEVPCKDHSVYLIIFITSRTNNKQFLLRVLLIPRRNCIFFAFLGNLRSTGTCFCRWLSRTILPPLSLELLFWRVTFAGTFDTGTGAEAEGGRGTGTGAGVGGGDGAEGMSVALGPYSILCFYKKTNH